MAPSRHKANAKESPSTRAELVVQNGRHSGTRKQLGNPLTYIGRARGCDLRLNVEGIEPLHCLLVQCPDGLLLRDLNTAAGTLVNGQRLASAFVHDGDLVTIGPFEFRLHLPASESIAHPLIAAAPSQENDRASSTPDRQEGLRVFVAALAAQQAALTEEEARLRQQRGTLEQQQDQLAAHLEDKQRSLNQLADTIQAERTALENARTASAQSLEKSSNELRQGQRHMEEERHQLQHQRRRLVELYRRLRHRQQNQMTAQWHRQTQALEQTAQKLRQQEIDLAGKQSEFFQEAANCRPAADGQVHYSSWHQCLPYLQRLAGDLVHQRLELTEQWQRLLQAQGTFQQAHEAAACELETLTRQVQQQETALGVRAQAQPQLDAAWQHRHEELAKLRQQLIGWRARAHIREAAWEGERQRLTEELQAREELANKHLHLLLDLRRRWAERRQQELNILQAERSAWARLRQENLGLRQQWAQKLTELEEDRRRQTEQELACDLWRLENGQGDAPAVQRRLERLRRSWIMQNAGAIRTWHRERLAFNDALLPLETLAADLQKRAEEVAAAEARLAEEQKAWEHHQLQVEADQSRRQQELRVLQARSTAAENLAAQLQEEMARLTGPLTDEANPPLLPMDRAA